MDHDLSTKYPPLKPIDVALNGGYMTFITLAIFGTVLQILSGVEDYRFFWPLLIAMPTGFLLNYVWAARRLHLHRQAQKYQAEKYLGRDAKKGS